MIKGYIVVGPMGTLRLVKRPSYPKKGILFYGLGCVTAFPTNKRAKGAIDRTKRYAKKLGYQWNVDAFYTQRIELTEQKKKGAKRGKNLPRH